MRNEFLASVAAIALAGCSFIAHPAHSRTPAIVDAASAVAATAAAIALGIQANRDQMQDDSGLLGGFADLKTSIDASGAVFFSLTAVVFATSAVYGFARDESPPVP